MGSLEAIESTEGPCAGMIFVWIFVGTFLNVRFDQCLVLALAQLFHQTFDVESFVIAEQAHFVQDASNVATCLLIVGEIEFFVFVNGCLWNVQ